MVQLTSSRRRKSDGGLRPLFREKLPRYHWVSVETGLTDQGVPDSNACHDGKEFWIEYKATNGWTCPLRPEQVGWITRRVRYGGNVFIITRRLPRNGDDELYIHHGGDARELKTNGLRGATPLGVYTGGPSRWDWDAIALLLSRPARAA